MTNQDPKDIHTNREKIWYGFLVIGAISGLTLLFRLGLSFYILFFVVIFLLTLNLYLLLKGDKKWLALLVLVCIGTAVLGANLGYLAIRAQKPDPSLVQDCLPAVELMEVYAAAVDIQQGSVMHDYMYVAVPMEMDLVVQSYMRNSDLIVGREALHSIRRGTILTEGLLIELQPVPNDQMSGMSGENRYYNLESFKLILAEALEKPDYSLLGELVSDNFYKHVSGTKYGGYEILDQDGAIQYIVAGCETLSEWLEDPFVDDDFNWILLENHAVASTHFIWFHEFASVASFHLGICQIDGRYYLCDGMVTVQ